MDTFNLNKYLYNNKLLTESYQPGDKWSRDFDFEGLLNAISNLSLSDDIELWQAIYDSTEDLNYHTENKFLYDAIEGRKRGLSPEEVSTRLERFQNEMMSLDEGKLSKRDIEERESPVSSPKKEEQILDIIMKYVEDPDDAEDQLDAYMDKGLDGVSNELAANLQRDKEFKALTGVKENTKESKLREYIRKEITTLLEAEEDEILDDIEAEVDEEEGEEEVEMDMEMGDEMEMDAVSDEAHEIQDHLEQAIELAKQMGDEKLSTQLGNTIVYLNRSQYSKQK